MSDVPQPGESEGLLSDMSVILDAVSKERDALRATFDLQWAADQRAIKAWQEAHPGNDLVWPDRADMVVWLMEELEQARGLAAHYMLLMTQADGFLSEDEA